MAELNENNSLTDIANSALVLIKEIIITSIEEDSDVAKAIRQMITPAIYLVQNSLEWNELIVSTTLDLAERDIVDGFYKYNKPIGFIKLYTENKNTVWKIEGEHLYVANNNTKVKYFKKNIEPATWSDELKECVILKLASKLATYISNDYKLGGQLEERYDLFQKKTIASQKAKRNGNVKNARRVRSWNGDRQFR